MKRMFIVCSIAFAACHEAKVQTPEHKTLTVIDYLKTEYKVDPQIHRFDSNYVNDLRAEHKSLNPDSLINSRIRQYRYEPLNLNFIEYYNRYFYKDRTDSDCYSVHLIRDNKTGTFYQDYIDADACIITEDYCMWSSMNNIITCLADMRLGHVAWRIRAEKNIHYVLKPFLLISIDEQKLQVCHPVEAGFAAKAEEWKYSSAPDRRTGKGLLEIKMPVILTL